MRFHILGPLEVHRGADRVGIGSRRERVVLAVLLLHAGQAVPAERLARALWGDAGPPTARTQIHHCISQLRRRLACRELIRTHAAGYLIAVGSEDLDALAFQHAIQAARASRLRDRAAITAGRLREALSLWRGPALAGLTGPVIADGTRQLEERRLLAWEELAELELALGRHHDLVVDLRERLAEAPMRQRLAGQLMLALYRSGLPADALETYRRVRAALSEHQGLDPSPRLRRLERLILTADPALDTPPAHAARPAAPRHAGGSRRVTAPRSSTRAHARGRAQLPAVPADFTGRSEPLSVIRAMLAGSREGPLVIAVSGAPGIGKSTVALRAAHGARELFPGGQLHVDLGGSRAEQIGPRAALDRLLRALDASRSAHGGSVEERAARFRDLVADRPVLLLIDDAPSAAHVHALLPGTPESAVLVTSRRRLTGLAGGRHIVLEPFSARESVALLERMLGSERVAAEAVAALEIGLLCGHLPLAVRIAGARLAARPEWRLARLADRLRGEEARLGELAAGELDVRASLDSSYRALAEPARRLLRVLSLSDGCDVCPRAAGAALGCPPDRAEALLECLVEESLLATREDRDAQARYRMPDLVRLFGRERAREEREGPR